MVNSEVAVEYKCRVCSTKSDLITEVRNHSFQSHLPREHVNHRYPFTSEELEVVASGDKDRYNTEVQPRNLPLRPGICILREFLPSVSDGATGLNGYAPPPTVSPCDRRIPLPGPPRPRGKTCKTSPTLDCHLCGIPGCSMVCGTAATEAINLISRATATQIQMQRAVNCARPTPFPTTTETAVLERAYNTANTRGYPTRPACKTLARQLGVEIGLINVWMAGERKARGQTVPSSTARSNSGQHTPRERSSSVEIRTRVTVLTRRLCLSAPCMDSFGDEYMEDKDSKPKAETEPDWPFSQEDRITLYAHEQDGQEHPRYAILDASPLYDSGDIESQDSGLGGLGAPEMEIKEN